MQPTHNVATPRFLPMISKVLGSSRRAGLAMLLALVGPVAIGLMPQAVARTAAISFDNGRLTARGAAKTAPFTFDLVTSAGAAGCLSSARGEVRISSRGDVQQMDVSVTGLPPNMTFTVFVLQLPHAPFGLSWYQGDLVTDDEGEGHAKFVGIFSDETFIVAPNVGPAPVEHPADASTNPQTAPVHLFHLGMWFDSTAEAAAANCPTGQTPFNGDHTAGIQIMNTTNFPDGNGPIGQSGQ